jgi:hypothetical protein
LIGVGLACGFGFDLEGLEAGFHGGD